MADQDFPKSRKNLSSVMNSINSKIGHNLTDKEIHILMFGTLQSVVPSDTLLL